jgi:TPR repeat protein
MKNLFLALLFTLFSLSNLFAQVVKFSLDPKSNLWGVKKGSNWLISPKYDGYENFDSQGFAKVYEKEYDDDFNIIGELIGLVDKYGNEIVKPKYDEIGTFSQDRAVVRKFTNYGYINKEGKEIIGKKYSMAHPFDSKGQAIVSMALAPKEQDYFKIDRNGNLVTENNIKIYFHDNGATSAKGKMVNGKKMGQWSFYSEDGYLFAIENYNNDGVAEGDYKRFFCFKYGYGENMNNNYPCQTGTYINGKRNGLIVYYNPNNGKPTYTELWENGVIKKVKGIHDNYGNLVSSTGTGTVNSYNEDSKYLSAKVEYQNGHRAGVCVWYHPQKTNSQVKQKALYKYDANDVNGLRWEIIEINDYNGNPLPKGTLKNGNGTWISYDENDKPTVITTYQNGKKVKEETALVKDIEKIYENILPNDKNNKVIAESSSAERAVADYSYDMAKGMYHFLIKEYTEALKYFKTAADKGEHEAMMYLGAMYYDGLGVAKDCNKAYQWTWKAKDKGNAKAALHLGNMYYAGKCVVQSYSEAYKWFKVAAAKGEAGAEYNIALLFELGQGVDKNFQPAFYRFKGAADKGSHKGAYKTGLYYYYSYDGTGVEKNIPQALKYMLQAEPEFTQDPNYYNTLAYCFFENGDFNKAILALQKAVKVDPDYANGYDSMGEMYLKSGNKTKAIEYYKKAAQMGYDNAIKWCKDNNIKY